MGINLCLANFEFISEHSSQVKQGSDFIAIDSFVTLDTKFEIEFDKNYSDIRMPMYIEEQRIFGGFSDVLVELNGKVILAKPKEYISIDNYNLMFV
jgi:hypothetical protein